MNEIIASISWNMRSPFRLVLIAILSLTLIALLLASTGPVNGAPDGQGTIFTPDNHRSDLGIPINVSTMEKEVLERTDLWTDFPLVTSDVDMDGHPEIYLKWFGHLQRYNTGNGSWEELPLDLGGNPQFHDLDDDGDIEIIYYEGIGNRFHVLDGMTFEEEWRTEATNPRLEQPKVFRGENGTTLILLVHEINEVALYTGSGELLWVKEVPGTDGYPRLAVGDLDMDGHLEFVVASFEKRGMEYTNIVTVCDVRTGATVHEWRMRTGLNGRIVTPPLIADVVKASRGMEIIVGRDGGTIWAISGTEGETIWTRPHQASYYHARVFETIRAPNGTYLLSMAREYIDVLWGETGELKTRLNSSLFGSDLGDIMLVDDMDPNAPGEEVCYVIGRFFVVYNPVLNATLWSHLASSDTRGVRFLLIRSPGREEFALHILMRDFRTDMTEHVRYFSRFESQTELVLDPEEWTIHPNVTNRIEGIELVGPGSDPSSIVISIVYQEELSRILIGRTDVVVINFVDFLQVTDATRGPPGQSRLSLVFGVMVAWSVSPNITYDVSVTITYSDGSIASFTSAGIIRVENRIETVGPLIVSDGEGGQLEEGQWVRGDMPLLFSGPSVRFHNSTVVPNPDDIEASGRSDHTSAERVPLASEGDLEWSTSTPGGVNGDVEWTLSITSIHTGQVVMLEFGLGVDSTPPSFLDFFPEDDAWSSDPATVLGSRAIDEGGSGIARVEVQLGRDLTSMGDWEPVSFHPGEDGDVEARWEGELEEGLWWVRWRLYDTAGNGPVVSDARSLSIDRTGVIFASFYPTGWSNTTPVEVGVEVSDSGGSGVDVGTMSISFSTDGLFGFSDWTTLTLDEAGEGYAAATVLVLVEGRDNHVRFKCSDLAGNMRVTAPYRVRVDTTSPVISGFSPSPGIVVDNRQPIEFTAEVTDGLSGVDDSSVGFRYRSGDGPYSDWVPCGPHPTLGSTYVATVSIPPGYDNHVQWRASDRAGSGMALSPELETLVNKPPEIAGLEPASPFVTREGNSIHFEVDVMDPEGDEMEISWEVDGTSLASLPAFDHEFKTGVHRVLLVIDDGHGNRVEEEVEVTVEEVPELSLYQGGLLLLVVIALVFAGVLWVRKWQARKEDGPV